MCSSLLCIVCFFCMQHVIFVVAGILAFLVPDTPQSVKNEIQREKLLAAEALNSAQEKSGIVQVRGKLESSGHVVIMYMYM